MDIVVIVLISAIVVWKNIYTIIRIRKYYKEKNKKHTVVNVLFIFNYLIYYYFVYLAAFGRIKSPLKEPLWLIVLFICLTLFNIYYDMIQCKFRD